MPCVDIGNVIMASVDVHVIVPYVDMFDHAIMPDENVDQVIMCGVDERNESPIRPIICTNILIV